MLSNGHQLFGEPPKRQRNILLHKFDMSELRKSEGNRPHVKILALQLIKDMIADNPSKRPAIEDIRKHPLWWKKEEYFFYIFEKLSFRVESRYASPDSLRMLERNARNIIRGDWKKHLNSNLMENLNLHDDFNGKSVGDLLRFIRKAVSCQVFIINASI